MVELLRRYSNRPDLYGPLCDVVRRIEENDQTNESGVISNGLPGSVTQRRRVDVDQEGLVDSYRSGVIIRELAERNGISVATVNRILRKHGVGRKDRKR